MLTACALWYLCLALSWGVQLEGETPRSFGGAFVAEMSLWNLSHCPVGAGAALFASVLPHSLQVALAVSPRL